MYVVKHKYNTIKSRASQEAHPYTSAKFSFKAEYFKIEVNWTGSFDLTIELIQVP